MDIKFKTIFTIVICCIVLTNCSKDGTILSTGYAHPYITISGKQIGSFNSPTHGHIIILNPDTTFKVAFGAKSLKKKQSFKYLILNAKIMERNNSNGSTAFTPIDADKIEYTLFFSGGSTGLTKGDSFEYLLNHHTFGPGVYDLKLTFEYGSQKTIHHYYFGVSTNP